MMAAQEARDPRFERIFTCAVDSGRGSELTADLGSPSSVGEARVVWARLSENGDKAVVNRLALELKYGEPIEW